MNKSCQGGASASSNAAAVSTVALCIDLARSLSKLKSKKLFAVSAIIVLLVSTASNCLRCCLWTTLSVSTEPSSCDGSYTLFTNNRIAVLMHNNFYVLAKTRFMLWFYVNGENDYTGALTWQSIIHNFSIASSLSEVSMPLLTTSL